MVDRFVQRYVWDRTHQSVTDYFTRQKVQSVSGSPFGSHAIAGFSSDLDNEGMAVDYKKGNSRLRMPDSITTLPISLRNVCIEVHTGRVFTFLGEASILYIFLMGIACIQYLWSGWKILKKHSNWVYNFFILKTTICDSPLSTPPPVVEYV